MKVNGKYSSSFNFILSRYRFRFNEVSGGYEYCRVKKNKPKKKWSEFNDRLRSTIMGELLEQQFDPPKNKVDDFIESLKISPDYDPFKAYFKSLPKWNKKTDYIAQLAKTVPVENQKHFYKSLKKFLVGSVDCLLRPDSVNDVCLVFQSAQGSGKTRWMRKLMPELFRKDYFFEGSVDTRNKDHVQYLSQNWFIHLDELESLKSNEIGALKSYITRQRISLRKAYGRYNSKMLRRASFLGSVNDDKFLSDTTGNRRWLVFKVIGLINYDHKIDIDMLWSQVYHIWSTGFKHWFDTDEIKEINNNNEKFRQISIEEELLRRFFKFTKKKGKGEYLSSSEVIEKIAVNVPQFNNKLTVIRMGKALAKHAKKKKFVGGIQTYYLKYLGSEHSTNTPTLYGKQKYKEINENDDVPF